ncbi:helix-turn-helix domain-containing protein [Salaquimonas pukyongi]|uniref:helix-turn-helix domain-containing protein n=1 Tax=Salaquimonas pukyongi TaxID=2712698 RepID=UPI00096B7CB7|nr:helix-turn-helix domain-containing protein [Salaquimonas pukyongi]
MPDKNTIFDQPVDSDTLGSRISRARDAAGMERATVAQNLGIKPSTLDSWEKDRSEPKAHHLVRLSGMLGVSPSWMLGGIGKAPLSDTLTDEVRMIRRQLEEIKAFRDQTSAAIENIERTLDRILAIDGEQQ